MTPPISINVLSTFDGIATGYLALERAGFHVASYRASEINPYSIKIAQKNFPDIIQIGSIENWQAWDLDNVDVFIGGPPCQGFSNAGKGLNFDDPRSRLFFQYADILDEIKRRNPQVRFLCENVKMKQAWQDIISDRLGVSPVLVNSALMSAQNRQRLYWTNWDFPLPEDRGLLLKDVLESGWVDREKSYALDYNYFKGTTLEYYLKTKRRQIVYEPAERVGEKGIKVSPEGVAYRKLLPVEAERLQTLPDGYTEGISDTRRYQVLGDGWTADILAHIFSFMYGEDIQAENRPALENVYINK